MVCLRRRPPTRQVPLEFIHGSTAVGIVVAPEQAHTRKGAVPLEAEFNVNTYCKVNTDSYFFFRLDSFFMFLLSFVRNVVCVRILRSHPLGEVDERSLYDNYLLRCNKKSCVGYFSSSHYIRIEVNLKVLICESRN